MAGNNSLVALVMAICIATGGVAFMITTGNDTPQPVASEDMIVVSAVGGDLADSGLYEIEKGTIITVADNVLTFVDKYGETMEFTDENIIEWLLNGVHFQGTIKVEGLVMLTASMSTFEKAKETINELEADLEEKILIINEKEKTIQDLQSSIKQLNQEIASQKETIDELGSKLKEAQTQLETLNGKITELNNKLKEATDKIDELKTELDQTKAKCDQLTQKNQQLEEENEELNEELADKEETLEALTAELDNALKELEDTKKEKEEMSAAIEELNEKNKELENKLIISDLISENRKVITDYIAAGSSFYESASAPTNTTSSNTDKIWKVSSNGDVEFWKCYGTYSYGGTKYSWCKLVIDDTGAELVKFNCIQQQGGTVSLVDNVYVLKGSVIHLMYDDNDCGAIKIQGKTLAKATPGSGNYFSSWILPLTDGMYICDSNSVTIEPWFMQS